MATEGASKLECEVSKPSNPQDGHRLWGLDIVDAKRGVDGNSSAKKRGCSIGGEFFRDRIDKAVIDDDFIGKSPKPIDACADLGGAHSLISPQAKFTGVARPTLPADTDCLSDLEICRSCLDDFADDFMSWDKRIFGDFPVVID